MSQEKSDEVMNFLHEHVFDPILNSGSASPGIIKRVNFTIMRLNRLNFRSKVQYVWSAISGTPRSRRFANMLWTADFPSFETVAREFGRTFNDEWLLGIDLNNEDDSDDDF